MGYDVLGLTELHNVHNRQLWKGKHWITSEDSEIDGQGHPTDPAAGVGILLSKRFTMGIQDEGIGDHLPTLGGAPKSAVLERTSSADRESSSNSILATPRNRRHQVSSRFSIAVVT